MPRGTAQAPNADITGLGCQFDGLLITKSFTGTTEFNDLAVRRALPAATPEPTTNLMIEAGLFLLSVISQEAQG